MWYNYWKIYFQIHINKGSVMPKKSMKKKKKENIGNTRASDILAVIFVAFSFYYIASMFSDKTGAAGAFIKNFTLGIFSAGGFAVPFFILVTGTNYIIEKSLVRFRTKYISFSVCILFMTALMQLCSQTQMPDTFGLIIKKLYADGTDLSGGGIAGGLINLGIEKLLGFIGAFITYTVIIVISVFSLFNLTVKELFTSLALFVKEKRENAEKIKSERKILKTDNVIKTTKPVKPDIEPENLIVDDSNFPDTETDDDIIIYPDTVVGNKINDEEEIVDNYIDSNKQVSMDIPANKPSGENSTEDTDSQNSSAEYGECYIENYKFPPLTLLKINPKNRKGTKESELMNNARKLVDILNSFGVKTKVLQVSKGPAITRYELQPMAGVKVSKIVNLSDDIALGLAAPAVRIEAPIPGKAAIGIEVPNTSVDMVSMREVLDCDEFKKHPSNLAVALGKDISGTPVIIDLAKMPHLLIAGATGSGKSVCINSIITSIMYKADPNDVKLILIDPKVVELSVYNGIPHLDTPVVTKAKKAAGALSWAVTEMMKRYDMFSEAKVRDIKGYNEWVKDNGYPKMPQVVIIIDELADLMMVAPGEVEDSICRLAQLARAAGMHLVIATQRPSVNVITGIIKANIPSRIAFAVTSQVDSRTILDMAGAEKLLGRGDMLYHPYGSGKPQRIQGAFISDQEVESLVSFVKGNSEANYNANISEHIEREAANDKEKSDTDDPGNNDELLPKAIDIIMDLGQASTSTIQRKLSVGYARAGRIMDQMEARGIVGPPNGSKPRDILLTREQYLELKNSGIFEEPIKY